MKEELWSDSEQAFWQDSKPSVEVETDMPNNPRAWNRALQDLPCHMVGAMKRRAIEVRERTLSKDPVRGSKGCRSEELPGFPSCRKPP